MNVFKVGDAVDIAPSIDTGRKDKITLSDGPFPQKVTSVSGPYVRFNGYEAGWSHRDFVKVDEGEMIAAYSPTGPSGAPHGLPISGKYDREVIGLCGKRVVVDVYRVLDAFGVTDPAMQHLIKKALCAGLRGHKNTATDLKDILHSAHKALELFEQKEAK